MDLGLLTFIVVAGGVGYVAYRALSFWLVRALLGAAMTVLGWALVATGGATTPRVAVVLVGLALMAVPNRAFNQSRRAQGPPLHLHDGNQMS